MNERLLLRLPHKQMAFTFPKVLCIFFRHDRNLYGEISRLIYRIIQTFYNTSAGRTIQSAAVIACASAGEFARFNPHIHAIVLEGGFDREGRFVHSYENGEWSSSVLHRFINGRLKAKIRRGCAVVDGEAHPYRCDAPGMGGCSVQNIQRPSVLPKKQGWSPWRRVLTLRISRKQLRMSACSLVRE